MSGWDDRVVLGQQVHFHRLDDFIRGENAVPGESCDDCPPAQGTITITSVTKGAGMTDEELKAIEDDFAKMNSAGGEFVVGPNDVLVKVPALIAEVRQLREALEARRNLCDGERLTPEQLTAEARLLGEID